MSDSSAPDPKLIKSAKWMKIVGAIFAATLLLASLILGGIASTSPGTTVFDCTAFSFFAIAFAIGSAASASFLGGGAAIDGDLGEAAQINPLRISLFGGVAVLLITFLTFFLLKPDDCNQSQVSKIKFEGIPGGFRAAAMGEFWTQFEGEFGGDATHMYVRVGRSEIDQGKISIRLNGEPVCEVAVDYHATLPDDKVGEFHHFRLNRGSAFKIAVRIDPDRARLGTPSDCFTYREHTISNGFQVDLGKSTLRFRKSLPSTAPTAAEFEIGDVILDHTVYEPRPMVEGFLNLFVSRAFAESRPATFHALAQSLASKNPDLRIDSRRYLGNNFSQFGPEVIDSLMLPDNQNNPELLTSLLHGLIDGVRKVAPGLAPSTNRNLAQTLPHMGAKELQRLVDLTGHKDPSVRKQSRRFLQTFPVDGFEPMMQSRVRAAQRGCRSEAEQWQTYAAIFFYYNRLIQEGLNEGISKQRKPYWDGLTNNVQRAATKCIKDAHKVDAALLDYGRATAYGWSREGWAAAATKDAALSFLDFVRPNAGDYYMTSHFKKMSTSKIKPSWLP